MTRRRGTAIGAATLAATVGVLIWGLLATAPADRGRAATRPTLSVRAWEPPVGDIGAALDAVPIEPPEVAEKRIQVGTTPTGLPLYMGPNGGVYHRSAGGRKVWHPDRRNIW